MFSLFIWFIISLLVLWLVVMIILWRKQVGGDVLREINPLIKSGVRGTRRIWFLILRGINTVRSYFTRVIAKLFFWVFPNAKEAFEKKDELAGLEQGPSSYFLMSISEGLPTQAEKEKVAKKEKRHGRKIKNV